MSEQVSACRARTLERHLTTCSLAQAKRNVCMGMSESRLEGRQPWANWPIPPGRESAKEAGGRRGPGLRWPHHIQVNLAHARICPHPHWFRASQRPRADGPPCAKPVDTLMELPEPPVVDVRLAAFGLDFGLEERARFADDSSEDLRSAATRLSHALAGTLLKLATDPNPQLRLTVYQHRKSCTELLYWRGLRWWPRGGPT